MFQNQNFLISMPNFMLSFAAESIIIRKTKCSRIFKRSASFSKTKRNFSKLSPYPKNLKKIDRLRRNFIHLKAVRTPS